MLLFKNNATTTLASGISSGATTITLPAGKGALFPNPGGGDTFLATLQEDDNIEVVLVSARSTDSLTVTRAQEGTTARAFTSDAVCELRSTAGMMNAFAQLSAALLHFTGSIGIGTVPTEKLHILDGNMLIEGSDETAIKFKRQGAVGSDVNPVIQMGRLAEAGIGRAVWRMLVSSDDLLETPVMAVEWTGTTAFIGTDYRPRSRVETYDGNGQVNPSLRMATWPAPGFEIGRAISYSAAGSVVRASNVTTVFAPDGHWFQPGDVISRGTVFNDPGFPSELNFFTISATPDGNHFSYPDTGANATSILPIVHSTETEWKWRSGGPLHMQLVRGPYGSETVQIDIFPDSIVFHGMAAVYEGGVIQVPQTIDHSMSPRDATENATYHCDASGGAIIMSLPQSGSYFGKRGRTYVFTKIDSSGNAVTPTAFAGDTIAGLGTYPLPTQYKSVTLQTDGVGHWFPIASN